MNIWIARHGQTELNRENRMQGLTDAPLNETGILQAQRRRSQIGDIHFDAVYASPLKRAITTAGILGDVNEEEIIIDPRIIEVDFGKYERVKFSRLGPFFSLYWAFPEIFPRPKSVEAPSSMIQRGHGFLKELEEKDYENVLVVCHGGIMRALSGYFEDLKNGIKWKPKPQNCEIRVYESLQGKHRFLRNYL